MNVILSSLSTIPIYEQIFKQIKEQIVTGALPYEYQLPSIRAMAKDLRVGIVTIKRAYEELERGNLIVTIPGRGCFVNKIDFNQTKRENLQEIKENLLKIKDFADGVNITREDIVEIFNEIYGGNNE